MRILKFKTNIRCNACVDKVAETLNREIESKDWNVDLESADRILTVVTSKKSEQIEQLMDDLGYKAELISQSEDTIRESKYDC